MKEACFVNTYMQLTPFESTFFSYNNNLAAELSSLEAGVGTEINSILDNRLDNNKINYNRETLGGESLWTWDSIKGCFFE